MLYSSLRVRPRFPAGHSPVAPAAAGTRRPIARRRLARAMFEQEAPSSMLAPSLPDFPLPEPNARDETWLVQHLQAVWTTHFADVPVVNRVEIAWARPWKTRLGLITLRHPSG